MAGFNSTLNPEIFEMFKHYSGSVRAEILRATAAACGNFATIATISTGAGSRAKLMFTKCGTGTMIYMQTNNNNFTDIVGRNKILNAVYRTFQIPTTGSSDIKITSSGLMDDFKLRGSIYGSINNSVVGIGAAATLVWPHQTICFVDHCGARIRTNSYGTMVVPILANKSFDDIHSILQGLSEIGHLEYKDVNISVVKKTPDDVLVDRYGVGVYETDRLRDADVLDTLHAMSARRIWDSQALAQHTKYDTWRMQALKRKGMCAVLYPTKLPYVSRHALYSSEQAKAKLNGERFDEKTIDKHILVAEVYMEKLFYGSNVNMDDGTIISIERYLAKKITAMSTREIEIDYDNNKLLFKNPSDKIKNMRAYAKNDFGIAATIEMKDLVIVIYSIAMPVKVKDLIDSNFNDYYYKWSNNVKNNSVRISILQHKFGFKSHGNKSYSFTSDPSRELNVKTAEDLIKAIGGQLPKTPKTYVSTTDVHDSDTDTTKPQRSSEVKFHEVISMLTAYMGTAYNNVARKTTDANKLIATIEALQQLAYVNDNIKYHDLSIHTVRQDYLVGRNTNPAFTQSGININRVASFSLHRYIQLNQYEAIHSEVIFCLLPGAFDSIVPTYKKIDPAEVKPNSPLAKYQYLGAGYNFYRHDDGRGDEEQHTTYHNEENVLGFRTADLANVVAVKKIFDVDNLFSVQCIVSARIIGMKLEVKD